MTFLFSTWTFCRFIKLRPYIRVIVLFQNRKLVQCLLSQKPHLVLYQDFLGLVHHLMLSGPVNYFKISLSLSRPEESLLQESVPSQPVDSSLLLGPGNLSPVVRVEDPPVT